ncbi:MAG: PAS domain S-box protein, partial [Desulfobacteraceae bacterium]|nr:PAS domain S-box protein [Desulfobacteraceae bacterium]
VEPEQARKAYHHFKPSADSILSHCISKQWLPINPNVNIPDYIDLPQTLQIRFMTIDDELYIEGIVSVLNVIYTELGEEKNVISGSVLLRKKVSNDFILKFAQKTKKQVDLFSTSGKLLLGSHMGSLNQLKRPLGQSVSQSIQFFDIDIDDQSYHILLKPYVYNNQFVVYTSAYTSKAIVNQSVQKVIIYQIGGLVVGLVFASFVTLVMGHFITQPIVDITKQMKNFSAEKVLDQKIHVHSKDEIGTLADTFNKMAANLVQRNSEIKHYVSELSEINQRLDESEKQYRSIFENARDGIFQIHPEGNILIANPAFLKILGYDSSADGFITPVDSDGNISINFVEQDEFNYLMKSKGYLKNFEAHLAKKDGNIIPVSISAHVVLNDKGDINYFEGIIEDITERKRTAELRFAKETAEVANRAKSDFLANMS